MANEELKQAEAEQAALEQQRAQALAQAQNQARRGGVGNFARGKIADQVQKKYGDRAAQAGGAKQQAFNRGLQGLRDEGLRKGVSEAAKGALEHEVNRLIKKGGKKLVARLGLEAFGSAVAGLFGGVSLGTVLAAIGIAILVIVLIIVVVAGIIAIITAISAYACNQGGVSGWVAKVASALASVVSDTNVCKAVGNVKLSS